MEWHVRDHLANDLRDAQTSIGAHNGRRMKNCGMRPPRAMPEAAATLSPYTGCAQSRPVPKNTTASTLNVKTRSQNSEVDN
jgi:hypothetical protein